MLTLNHVIAALAHLPVALERGRPAHAHRQRVFLRQLPVRQKQPLRDLFPIFQFRIH